MKEVCKRKRGTGWVYICIWGEKERDDDSGPRQLRLYTRGWGLMYAAAAATDSYSDLDLICSLVEGTMPSRRFCTWWDRAIRDFR